jgi:Tfp pilus assembly protein PilO
VTPKKKEAQKIAESLPYERYLPISVVLIGEYENIVTFLYRMETLPYGLDVIGMKVKKREIDEIVTKPSSPGRNPFLILAQGETITTETEEEQAIPGSLEATIETAVYINKQSDL